MDGLRPAASGCGAPGEQRLSGERASGCWPVAGKPAAAAVAVKGVGRGAAELAVVRGRCRGCGADAEARGSNGRLGIAVAAA